MDWDVSVFFSCFLGMVGQRTDNKRTQELARNDVVKDLFPDVQPCTASKYVGQARVFSHLISRALPDPSEDCHTQNNVFVRFRV